MTCLRAFRSSGRNTIWFCDDFEGFRQLVDRVITVQGDVQKVREVWIVRFIGSPAIPSLIIFDTLCPVW